jgi:hypothetical protein
LNATGSPSVRDPASFRDPAGFVYRRDGTLYRQIHESHAEEWLNFKTSGLHDRLVERRWLIRHEEAEAEHAYDDRAWRVLRPELIPFISYPYEWTFSQLKDAALLTLSVQELALDAGMTLKDASAYNVQFTGGRPILIDALSFERAEEGTPWIAYRQFCQHFLAPLALMAERDVRCGLMLREWIDGIPLDLAVRLLPARTRLRFGLATHLHLHARSLKQHEGDGATSDSPAPRMSRSRLEALLANLRSTVAGLNWEPKGTQWADYTATTSYTDAGAASKQQLVERFLRSIDGEWVWDLGANTGVFSRLATGLGRKVIAIDTDPAAAEQHYRTLKQGDGDEVMPLVMDLANPSPALGWANRERLSLVDRANADVLIALALVHHIAIGNNVPLPDVSSLLAKLGRQLIIEFVPKSDPRVASMLAARRDIFHDYSLEGLRAAFATHWQLLEEEPIHDSTRTLLLFRRS